MKSVLFIIISSFLLFSCSRSDKIPKVSFYYWKTIFELTETERRILRQNNVECLYIRYFDVDIQDEAHIPIPVSPVQFSDKPDSFNIIPVIYIKNRVMKEKGIDLQDLTNRILYLINQINKKNGLNCNEIQIDCDWTLESRDNFMEFISIIRKNFAQKISVTIRLHQVKYFYKTKVPNADYGVLMYYNMGKIAPDSLNSIYDQVIATKYLASLKTYPLNLEVALPVFSNAIHISDNKVVNLYSKRSLADFANDTNFIPIGANRVRALHPNLKAGIYFKQNDEIKAESISFDNLKQMAIELNKYLAKKPEKIIFFDLDSINLKPYYNEDQELSEIADCF